MEIEMDSICTFDHLKQLEYFLRYEFTVTNVILGLAILGLYFKK